MEEEQNSAVSSTPVLEFIAVADQYCRHVKRAQGYQPAEFLSVMQRLLPFLYLKTISLPAFESVFEEGNEHFVNEDEYNMVESSVAILLGPANSFEEAFDTPVDGSGEPVAGLVSEYLADIYQHLRDCVLQYQIGTHEVMNDAVWECQLNFETIWGTRLLSVLRAIHRILYSGKNPGELFSYGGDTRHYGEEDKSSWFISRRQKEYGEE